MNIHLVLDEKFINQFVIDFERFYPNENLFFVLNSKFHKIRFVSLQEKVVWLKSTNVNLCINKIEFLLGGKKIKNIFVHFLFDLSGNLGVQLKKKYKCNLYWIFYGADLYNILEKTKNYPLYDRKLKVGLNYKVWLNQLLKKYRYSLLSQNKYSYFYIFLNQCDYFCFWNPYDYQLIIDNFQTNMKFKYFHYNLLINNVNSKIGLLNTNQKNILLNHSSSLTGNHLTLIDKIASLDSANEYNVVIPLSYGDKKLAKLIIDYSKIKLKGNFLPLLDFLTFEEFNSILINIPVALFGHKRQEAAGTIFMLLSNGTKIFLRDQNNLFRLLKEWGFIVYSFEKDINSVKDFQPLTFDERKINFAIYNKHFSEIEFEKMMKNIIDIK